ncbi:hypothetical protein BS47DRAFT_1374220 [Hydnum rufescens UP504]|uniref:NTF2 domain-containing protein n=1 Tax=Hydnum rufescens UP504 TaxID=1448309 RepID=A0A9P6AHI1_9AGAM|nr:hypothetical protein BS47DRAFT_1374220 [Hydnum rufescens UP504]
MTTGKVARSDVDVANRGAENFVRIFYAAYDSAQRGETVPKFYRPNTTFNWNGTHIKGDEIRDFLLKIPPTKHEVQSYDCHAVPGTQPPSLLIVVSGTVAHGTSMDANSKTLENIPRAFSQTFLLLPEVPGPIGQAAEPKYFVITDSMRFVG